MYYNTTNESGSALKNYWEIASSQDDAVFEIFKYMGRPMSASAVWAIYGGSRKCPLTSIRRAMTNLVNDNKLVKTDGKRMGLYGRNEYLYKLAE